MGRQHVNIKLEAHLSMYCSPSYKLPLPPRAQTTELLSTSPMVDRGSPLDEGRGCVFIIWQT